MKINTSVLAATMALFACGCSNGNGENPLLSEFTTPYGIAPFDQITIEDYREGMLLGMEQQQAEIAAIIANQEKMLKISLTLNVDMLMVRLAV